MSRLLKPLLTLLAVLAPAGAFAGPLSLDAALKNSSLDAKEGDTFLRVTVQAQSIKLDTRMPMNLAVVIDRSGSMAQQGPSHTEKMGDAKTSAKFLVDQLDDRDTLTVISFDDGAEVLAQAGKMTPDNKQKAKKAIDTLYARGGTDMIAGLKAGIGQVKERVGQGEQVNRVILISDGVPNVSDGLVDLSRDAQSRGISVSTLGVGVDYNEDLMSHIAMAGNGGYYFVADASKLPAIFTKELHSLMAVVAKNAALKIEFGSGVKPVKVYGYDAQVTPETTIVRLGDIVGGQMSEVLLKIHHPGLTGEHPIARVELMYQDAFQKTVAKESKEVAAKFVGDPRLVEASLDAKTGAKAEQVATGEAVNQAMDAYARGDKDEAKKIIATRRAEMNAAPVAAAPMAAPAMAKAKKSLDFADDAIMAKPAATRGYSGAEGVSAASKAAKEDAYDLAR